MKKETMKKKKGGNFAIRKGDPQGGGSGVKSHGADPSGRSATPSIMKKRRSVRLGGEKLNTTGAQEKERGPPSEKNCFFNQPGPTTGGKGREGRKIHWRTFLTRGRAPAEGAAERLYGGGIKNSRAKGKDRYREENSLKGNAAEEADG